jgi:hypothetical protein
LKPGNANLPIDGLRSAIQENGVPGMQDDILLALNNAWMHTCYLMLFSLPSFTYATDEAI